MLKRSKKIITLGLFALALATSGANLLSTTNNVSAAYFDKKGSSTSGGYTYAYTVARNQAYASVKIVTTEGGHDFDEKGTDAKGYKTETLWAQTDSVVGIHGTHTHKVTDTNGDSLYDRTDF